MRLGDGVAMGLSPDGRWVTANTPRADPPQLWLYPTGAGEKRLLPTGKLSVESSGDFLPDGKSIVFTAAEPSHGTRVFTISTAGGAPRAVTPEGYRLVGRSITPDGSSFVVIGPDRRRYLYRLAGGEPQPIPGLADDETAAGWSSDGRFLYVFRRRDVPAKVWRLDVTTGKRELWKELVPADSAGIQDLGAGHPDAGRGVLRLRLLAHALGHVRGRGIEVGRRVESDRVEPNGAPSSASS